MPYSFAGKNTAAVLTNLFGENFLLIAFLVLIIFLMENQSFFQEGISSLNGKIGSLRSILDAVSATVSALQTVVEAPSAINPAAAE